MKSKLLLTAMALLGLVLASPNAAQAQDFVYNFGGGFIDSNPFGGQIGHRQQGTFGTFTPDDRWIGIGNPTFGGALLPVYGMRIQDAGQSATFSLNEDGGVRDLEIQWGPEEESEFHLNFIQDITNPAATQRVLTGLSDGRVSIGTDNPASAGLTVHDIGTYAIEARSFGNTTRGMYVTGQYMGIDARIQGTTTSIIGQRYGIYTRATSNNGSINYGLYSYGQNGTGSNYGIRTFAQNPSAGGTAYGIYASQGVFGTNFAGYFAGNVTVTGTFNNSSDRRLKDNISTEVGALDRIMQLRPTTYEYKKDEKYQEMHLADGLQHGFIAQELEEVFPEMVGTGVQFLGESQFADPDKVAEEGEQPLEKFEYKTVNYISMIPVLTKGIQEQQAEIEEKDARIAELERKVELLMANANTSKAGAATDIETANVLYQNSPNPFSARTEIRYELSGEGTAEILVFDMNGRQLRSFTDLEAGNSSITIEGSEFEAGMYFYSLIVNGEEVATKRMILTK